MSLVLVTGASQGIGFALARRFASKNYQLLLTSKNKTNLKKAVTVIEKETGIKTNYIACDLGKKNERLRLVKFVKKRGLQVDFLINNAGIGECGYFYEAKKEKIDELINVNISALVSLTRLFLPSMIKRNEGGILNVASIGGFLPGPHQSIYFASKAFVLSFTKALAYELKFSDVKIATLVPGPVESNFHEKAGASGCYYIPFLGVQESEKVANYGYKKFMSGYTFILPGLMNNFIAPFMRWMPHFIMMPLMEWLLIKR